MAPPRVQHALLAILLQSIRVLVRLAVRDFSRRTLKARSVLFALRVSFPTKGPLSVWTVSQDNTPPVLRSAHIALLDSMGPHPGQVVQQWHARIVLQGHRPIPHPVPRRAVDVRQVLLRQAARLLVRRAPKANFLAAGILPPVMTVNLAISRLIWQHQLAVLVYQARTPSQLQQRHASSALQALPLTWLEMDVGAVAVALALIRMHQDKAFV